MTREDVIDKVRKLYALGESDNPHEAALAVGRAQALMERHAIETAELDGGGDDEVVEIPFGPVTKQRSTWRGMLANAVAQANGCFSVNQTTTFSVSGARSNRNLIAGREEDVAAAIQMLRYCEAEIDRLAAKFAAGLGREWAMSFRIGCVHAIQTAIDKERRAAQDAMRETVSETALTVVDDRSDRAKESFGEIENKNKKNVVNLQREAAAAGMLVGRDIFAGTKGRIGG